MAPEGVVGVFRGLDPELDDCEVDSSQFNGVRWPAKACLDKGGCRQRGDVQDAAGTRYPLQRLGHRGVGQLYHERQLRPDLFDAECRLERVDLVDLDAHHRGGTRQAGFLESLPSVGVAPDMGNVPVVQSAGEAWIGVVVDHDDLGATEVELLDGAETDALKTAHDHMTVHVLEPGALHAGMLPGWRIGEVAAALNVGADHLRRLEPHLGAVAQWSEQRTHNPWVVGSIPTSPTNTAGRRGFLGQSLVLPQ